MTEPAIVVRQATEADGPALSLIDYETWDPIHTPAERWAPDKQFFSESCLPGYIWVAQIGDAIAGYVRLEPFLPVPSAAHVMKIGGFVVATSWRRRGVAATLLAEAVRRARETGARKLTLNVLGSNGPAIAAYSKAGFVEEGRRTELFLLNDAYVDDLTMSMDL